MKLRSCLILAAAAFTTSLQAANITYGGFIEGSLVSDWRTPATSKSLFDIDGNNVFGSMGAIHWTGPTTGITGTGVFGWSPSTQTGGQVASPGAAMIDLLGSPGQKSMAGIGIAGSGFPTVVNFTLNGTPADYSGKMVRISLMGDLLETAFWARDRAKSYQITGPGGADSGVISLRGGNGGDGVPEFYFFDITNVVPGDTFTITAAGQPVAPNGIGYIGTMALDIAAVPEPGSAICGILGLGTLLAKRRRARAER